MKQDPLSEATRALRETDEASEFEARATRTRVMAGLHQTRVRRRTRLAFLLPIAASFVAVSAWGAASGKGRLVLDQLERLAGITASTPARSQSIPAKLAVRSTVTAAIPEQGHVLSAPTTPSAAPLIPEAKVAPPAAISEHAARLATSVSAPPVRAEEVDPTLTLYRIAHAAHFVDHDPARALAAWDAYLETAPNGAFAPEARYNRALSLIRLGRTQEARSALEPFASGAYGGYRKAEASALLERIGP